MHRFSISTILLTVAVPVVAQAVPSPVIEDPPADSQHRARLEAVHIPSHGVRFNGTLYLASGASRHPTAILIKGMPAIKQNLDLAQAIRRAGWNVLTMHPRGSWGSPGSYSYQHLLEDLTAAIDFVRGPANSAAFSIDPERLVLIGDSSGGFISAVAAAKTRGLAGLVLISAVDDASRAGEAAKSSASWQLLIKDYAEFPDGLVGCTPSSLAMEARHHASSWSFTALAPSLRTLPVLIITSDGGFARDTALADEIVRHGGAAPRRIHMATDHAYSDHRTRLIPPTADYCGPRPEFLRE